MRKSGARAALKCGAADPGGAFSLHSVAIRGQKWPKVVEHGPEAWKSRRRDLRTVELTVLMGHAPAKIDEKGRLKIPSGFRKIIEERYGQDCFITSTDGERALIY